MFCCDALQAPSCAPFVQSYSSHGGIGFSMQIPRARLEQKILQGSGEPILAYSVEVEVAQLGGKPLIALHLVQHVAQQPYRDFAFLSVLPKLVCHGRDKAK